MDRFSVLFVCHANMCRSPMAERLAAHLWTQRFGDSGVDFGSAGTDAMPGLFMVWGTATVLTQYGADNTGFAARHLDPELIAGSDLVLTATRSQRSEVVSMRPDSMGRAYTLRQFGRMVAALDGPVAGVGSTPVQRMRALVQAAPLTRSRLQPVPPELDDLPDPVGRPLEDFQVCAAEVSRILDLVIDA